MRNQTIIVDINKEICKILKYKQYDSNNILQIIVEENYKKINLENYIGFAFFQLPSGLIIKKDCEIQENVITIIVDNNILSENGKILLDLTLSNGEEVFTLFRINLIIEETIDREEAIIIEAGWDIVAEIAKFNSDEEDRKQSEEERKQAEEERKQAEEERYSKEEERIRNEINRQNEELKRIANETQRLIREEERITNENIRTIKEEERITNENIRISNENIRISNENIRSEFYEGFNDRLEEVNLQLEDGLEEVNSQLEHIKKYDVVIGLGCDNKGLTEIGNIIQSFLDNTEDDKINLFFPPGTYKWNVTVTTDKTLFINGERGNVLIKNSGNLACLKHKGNCTINGMIFDVSSTNRSEYTVYSNGGTEFFCYNTIFTCTSGKINGVHIQNTIISHIDRCKFNQAQISLKTWDCKITNTWVWALWRPYGIGIHGGCGNITISNVDVVPPFKTSSGDMNSSDLLQDMKAGIWINSEGGNNTNNVILENIYLDGNPNLYTGVGLACENVFGITLSTFRANKMSDYPIVINGSYGVIISKGVFFDNNKLNLVDKNEILITNPDNRKCDNIIITDNQFINHQTGYTNQSPAIKVDDNVVSPITIKYNKISQQSGNDCVYGDIGIVTPSMEDLSTNTGSKYAYRVSGSFVIPSGSTGVSLTLPSFMAIEPTQKNFRFWVDNGFLPSLRVQKNQKNNVWIGVQTAPTQNITIYYEVNI